MFDVLFGGDHGFDFLGGVLGLSFDLSEDGLFDDGLGGNLGEVSGGRLRIVVRVEEIDNAGGLDEHVRPGGFLLALNLGHSLNSLGSSEEHSGLEEGNFHL